MDNSENQCPNTRPTNPSKHVILKITSAAEPLHDQVSRAAAEPRQQQLSNQDTTAVSRAAAEPRQVLQRRRGEKSAGENSKIQNNNIKMNRVNNKI